MKALKVLLIAALLLSSGIANAHYYLEITIAGYITPGEWIMIFPGQTNIQADDAGYFILTTEAWVNGLTPKRGDRISVATITNRLGLEPSMTEPEPPLYFERRTGWQLYYFVGDWTTDKNLITNKKEREMIEAALSVPNLRER